MATITITRTLCDMPHDDGTNAPEDAFPVAITTPDGTWDVDLCATHAARFLLAPISHARQQRRPGRKAAPVLPLVAAPED